jgi:hypothetical protein
MSILAYLACLALPLAGQALRHCEGARGIKSRWALPSCTTDGQAGTTPKPCVQLTNENERARYCTQYIARSLSARNAAHTSGERTRVGGDLPVCRALIKLAYFHPDEMQIVGVQ